MPALLSRLAAFVAFGGLACGTDQQPPASEGPPAFGTEANEPPGNERGAPVPSGDAEGTDGASGAGTGNGAAAGDESPGGEATGADGAAADGEVTSNEQGNAGALPLDPEATPEDPDEGAPGASDAADEPGDGDDAVDESGDGVDEPDPVDPGDGQGEDVDVVEPEPQPEPGPELPGPTGGAFGNDTPGGRGGAVIRVTNLQPAGPGSIGAALNASGPRIVVFEVGGIIDLDRARLDVVEPFLTLAGQTAPSPGITLIRGGLRVRTHDVRIEHLRFRMGDAGVTEPGTFEPDVTTDGGEAHDVVFDHVSVAWGVDENLSVSGPRFDGPDATSHRVTIRDSIIAEGLLNSVHEKGTHSMGSLIHDYCTDIAVVGNLYAHNNERNPWFKGFASGAIVNNVVYDPGRWAMRLGSVNSEWEDSGITPQGPRVSVLGNVMRHGANTPPERAMVDSNSNGAAFLRDNVVADALGQPGQVVTSNVEVLAASPPLPNWLELLSSADVVDRVVAQAGARPLDRDSVDRRIIADFLAGTGGFVDSQNQVGGYPTAAATARALDVPADVDAWLERLAAELEGTGSP